MNVLALRAFFNTQAPQHQKLGTIDCVKFVTDAVFIGWGRDYRNILQYDSRRSAIDRLRELGGLQAACIHALGPMYPMEELTTGDVVWFDQPSSIGLLMPHYIALKMGHTIHRFDIEPEMRGWKTDER